MDTICICGHHKAAHSFTNSYGVTMGWCRPGGECEAGCKQFTPREIDQATAPFGEVSKHRLEILLRMERSRADAAERRVRDLENLIITRLDL